jgi:hypothetical protein
MVESNAEFAVGKTVPEVHSIGSGISFVRGSFLYDYFEIVLCCLIVAIREIPGTALIVIPPSTAVQIEVLADVILFCALSSIVTPYLCIARRGRHNSISVDGFCC